MALTPVKIPNQPVTFEAFQLDTQNYDGKNGGSLNMFQGLAGSINNIVAYLMKQVGPESVIELRRYGHYQPHGAISIVVFGFVRHEQRW